MTTACPAPDETLGVVLRLSTYLDCQGRALGENGFDTLAGGPIVTGVLEAAITIFVALIGYRLILGPAPSLGDGVGRAVRLGFVLALATSWPAFQTLVYRVAIDAPEEVAAVLLPAVGLPSDDVGARTQAAYDAIRRGVYSGEAAEPPPSQQQVGAQQPAGQTPPAQRQTFGIGLSASPVSASALVASSVGVGAALRLATGLLVAIGPLAIVALLFDATAGLVASWARALGASALGVLATTMTGALQLVTVESEISRAGAIQSGMLPAGSADPQAFVTIAAIFGLIPLVLVYAMFRATAGLRLRFGSSAVSHDIGRAPGQRAGIASTATDTSRLIRADVASRTRAAAISDALASSAHRDLRLVESGATSSARRQPIGERRIDRPSTMVAPLGQAGRRTSARRSQAAVRRDGKP